MTDVDKFKTFMEEDDGEISSVFHYTSAAYVYC
jgi:hypothetical protein